MFRWKKLSLLDLYSRAQFPFSDDRPQGLRELCEVHEGPNMGKILVVEDDSSVQETLQYTFSAHGYEVDLAADGPSGLNCFLSAPPAAVILDLQLPGMTGEDLCRHIKTVAPSLPTIILTAKGDVTDTVLLLEAGADDYIRKPFSPREVLARVERAIRRSQGSGNAELLSFAEVVVNVKKMTVTLRGAPVSLTPQEFKLLQYFCRNPNRVISRDELLNEVWGYESYPTTRTVDNHVLRLRHKLENDPAEPDHFQTVHAVGYMFVI